MTSNELRARRLAESFRAEHGLGDLPIKDVFELVHVTLEVDVLSMDAGEGEHGLSMLDGNTSRAVIVVATTSHPMRQRSSVAHEIGHVIAGDLEKPESLVPGERNRAEICADAFARHLLVPLDALRRQYPPSAEKNLGLRELSDVVQEFEVSPQVAAIQLREVKAITRETCEEWSRSSAAQLAANFGWLSQYRSLVADSERPRAPQRLMARAVDGYRHGVLGVAELAAWYDQDPGELEEHLGLPDLIPADDSTEIDDGDLFPGLAGPGA